MAAAPYGLAVALTGLLPGRRWGGEVPPGYALRASLALPPFGWSLRLRLGPPHGWGLGFQWTGGLRAPGAGGTHSPSFAA